MKSDISKSNAFFSPVAIISLHLLGKDLIEFLFAHECYFCCDHHICYCWLLWLITVCDYGTWPGIALTTLLCAATFANDNGLNICTKLSPKIMRHTLSLSLKSAYKIPLIIYWISLFSFWESCSMLYKNVGNILWWYIESYSYIFIL